MVSFIASDIFKIEHLQKETIIEPIGLNVHKTPPACTLCMFTVHKKLSVAHTGDFNHTNYTLK